MPVAYHPNDFLAERIANWSETTNFILCFVYLLVCFASILFFYFLSVSRRLEMDFYMTDLLKIYIHYNVIISDYTIIAEIGKKIKNVDITTK